MKTREISVTGLAIGDIIIDGKTGILVKTITPCTQYGKLHVNETLCYDNISTIEIIRKEHS